MSVIFGDNPDLIILDFDTDIWEPISTPDQSALVSSQLGHGQLGYVQLGNLTFPADAVLDSSAIVGQAVIGSALIAGETLFVPNEEPEEPEVYVGTRTAQHGYAQVGFAQLGVAIKQDVSVVSLNATLDAVTLVSLASNILPASEYYFVGGEDIDFPNSIGVTGAFQYTSTTAAHFRSGYARCAIGSNSAGSNVMKSKTFAAGELTSCWFTCRFYWAALSAGRLRIGLGKSGTESGIYFGESTASTAKISVSKWNGTARTELAVETGTSVLINTLTKLDVQILSYSASTTIRVYINSNLVLEWTGDTRISGVTGLDRVMIYQAPTAAVSVFSEIIVSNKDTRMLSLGHHIPTAAGDLSEWTGMWSDIDETTQSDTDILYTRTPDLTSLFVMSNLPAGQFEVRAICPKVRANFAGHAGAAQVKLGVKSDSSIDLDAGQSPIGAWDTYERIMLTVNGGTITPTQVDAMQLAIKSAA